jgi:replicative DNA helicase Mcm
MSDNFEDFLKTFQERNGNYKYRARIAHLIATGAKSVIVDYEDLLQFDADICNKLLQDPDASLEEFRKAAYETLSAENAQYADKIRKVLSVRIRGITDRVLLRKVDASYLDKMIAVSGMVVRASELRPLLVEGMFICPNKHDITQLQDGIAIRRPIRCEACGESKNIELDNKRSSFIDSQILRIQELPEELPPGQLPQFFDVDALGDMVNLARPGDRIVLTGIVRAEPEYTPGQGRTRWFKSRIECNFIEAVGKEPENIQISKEDEILIRSIPPKPEAYQNLINSIAPAIIGHEAVKEAILLLLAGAPQTTLPDGTKLRGDINVLLVGDPGVAKSELLKFAAQVAPRGLFASGRGSTAAGLSAAVIREKNVLMLEAGVVVLADQGIACIDEFDKMRPEDRSALHEQMEQQSYHPFVEIQLSDGSKRKIGDLVEDVFRGEGSAAIRGKDCYILPLREHLELYSVEGGTNKIIKPKVDRVSKHLAPNYFVSIDFSNGRSILVTPEHPVYVLRNGEIQVTLAEEMRIGEFVPAPRQVPNSSVQVALSFTGGVALVSKHPTLPTTFTAELCRILGYLVSEGNTHVSLGDYEVSFTNLDRKLLNDVRFLMLKIFNLEPTARKTRMRRIVGLRFISKELFEWLRTNFPEINHLAREKRAPAKVLGASMDLIAEFLSTAFLGDGEVESEVVCYRTSSRGLAEDYQDLLLKLGIASRIDYDSANDSFKVYVTDDSLEAFVARVVDQLDRRKRKIERLVRRGKRALRIHDVMPPSMAGLLRRIHLKLGLGFAARLAPYEKSGYGITRLIFTEELRTIEEKCSTIEDALRSEWSSLRDLRKMAGLSQEELGRLAGVQRGAIDYLERGGYSPEYRRDLILTIRNGLRTSLSEVRRQLDEIGTMNSLSFLRVKGLKKVPNTGVFKTKWVYDVTVEPTHNFISHGLILHNTTTVAKGGIYATLNARTAILAAVNPVLGKYNTYQNLTDNINLPIPLLTRFDIIFVIKDTPTPAQDEKLATHILEVHRKRGYAAPPPIQFDLLKKYITYAKKISPTLTKEAEDRLKEYYLSLRRNVTEGQIGATPRTIESLIRLASAKARLLLREQILEEDALAAISLMNRMVEDVLTDTETKTRGDFGVLLGKPIGERNKRATAMEIFRNLEGADKKPVERKIFKDELIKTGRLNDDEADKIIQGMIREGIIYETKPGFFRRVAS